MTYSVRRIKMRFFLIILLVSCFLNAKPSERELNNFARQIIDSKVVNFDIIEKDKFTALQKSLPELLKTVQNKKERDVNRYLAFKKLVALAKVLSYKECKASIAIYKEIFKLLSNSNKLSYLNLLLDSLDKSDLKALPKEEKEYLASSLKKCLLDKEAILKIIKNKQDKNVKDFIKLIKSAPAKRPKYAEYMIEDFKNRQDKNFKKLKNALANSDAQTYFEKLKKIPTPNGEKSIFQKIERYWCFFKTEYFDNLDKEEYLDCLHTVFNEYSSVFNEQKLLAGLYMAYENVNRKNLKVINRLEK